MGTIKIPNLPQKVVEISSVCVSQESMDEQVGLDTVRRKAKETTAL